MDTASPLSAIVSDFQGDRIFLTPPSLHYTRSELSSDMSAQMRTVQKFRRALQFLVNVSAVQSSQNECKVNHRSTLLSATIYKQIRGYYKNYVALMTVYDALQRTRDAILRRRRQSATKKFPFFSQSKKFFESFAKHLHFKRVTIAHHHHENERLTLELQLFRFPFELVFSLIRRGQTIK